MPKLKVNNKEVEFENGMTVLTGETGAGKSILLDALGLILGDRADTSVIRGGSEKTDITAIFSIKNNIAIREKLSSLEIEPNNDDAMSTRNVFSRPIQKPIIEIILTSPIPIPSFFRISKNNFEVPSKTAPLMIPPQRLSASDRLKTE